MADLTLFSNSELKAKLSYYRRVLSRGGVSYVYRDNASALIQSLEAELSRRKGAVLEEPKVEA
jgi:hypothetical protein